MLVPDLVFDLLLFGALLLGATLDGFVPSLHGVASLLAVGGATYIAAQEFAEWLERRGWWTQESLATAVAVCTAGFLYYWWRNQSDLSLLALSIGLMMASLMVTIAIIASIGAVIRNGSVQPILSFLMTVIGATILGLCAGLLILVLGRANSGTLLTKIIVVALAMIAWKLRETMRPPALNATANSSSDTESTSTSEVSAVATSAPGSHAGARRALIPQRGTLLDRFWPALMLGALLFLFSRQGAQFLHGPIAPAAAESANSAPNNADNSTSR